MSSCSGPNATPISPNRGNAQAGTDARTLTKVPEGCGQAAPRAGERVDSPREAATNSRWRAA